MTQWFPPEPGALVPESMARSLAQRGHEVHVLTGFPNYPTGHLPDGWRIRPYQRDEFAPGITVHRAPLYPSHDVRPVPRMGNYLSFALGATSVALTRLPRPDVWLTYSSPATAALPAMLARRGMRAPTGMVIQDLWPDSVTGSGFVKGRAARTIDAVLEPFCRWTYHHADAIGVISPGMGDLLVSRGVHAARIHPTPNSVDDTFIQGASPVDLRSVLGIDSGRIFLYAGNFGPMQDLLPLVTAFSGLDHAHLVLLGDGVERPAVTAAAAGLPNVHVLPPVPTSEVGGWLLGADVQVVSLRDDALLRVTMPSKVQTSLATGRPVLVHAAGDAADLITGAGAGRCAPPGDVHAVRAAVTSMTTASEEDLGQMGTNARTLYEERFTTSAAGRQLEAMLMAAVRRGEQ